MQIHRHVSTGLHTCSWYTGVDRIHSGCGEDSNSWLAEWEGRKAWDVDRTIWILVPLGLSLPGAVSNKPCWDVGKGGRPPLPMGVMG